MTNERLKVIAYNAICGLHELVGFDSNDVESYCAISNKEYVEVMYSMNDDDDKQHNGNEAIAIWVKEYLEPTIKTMPGSSTVALDYINEKGEQYIEVTYDNGYKRKACVTADNALACIFDLMNQHVIK